MDRCLSLRWLGDDHAKEEDAVDDARLHSEGKRPPWHPEEIVEWDQRSPAV
jgi:hypothetical protein